MASPGSSPSQGDRQQRLHQLASEWGITSLPPPSPLTRPLQSPLSPSVRTPDDSRLADELLQRRRENALPQQSGSIKRAFSAGKKKDWEPKEIFEALDACVGNAGSAGVAEALIFKLHSAGGNINLANMKSRTNLLTRRKSVESFERSKILQKAIDNRQTDMVAVLVPHADPFTLDNALPMAIRSGDIAIAELLLRHGANASQTADGQDAFRQLCIVGGQGDLVGLILQSDGRPSPSWVSQAMIDAGRKGCLETVLRLSRSTADGNYNNAAALKETVSKCRVDIAIAILTGNKPPVGQGLNEAFANLFSHPSIMPNDKIAFAELLLCAGAQGDVVSAALVEACATEFYEMVDLLVTFGASVEFQDAVVLRNAVSKGQSSLVHLLLKNNSPLSPMYATECVELIPKRLPPEDRHAFLSTLLRKGAGGPPIDDALIDAVEAGDLESVKLLTTPHFSGGRVVEGQDGRVSRGMVYDRHETASVDHKGGLALQLAVLTGNLAMVKYLLSGKPSEETLAEVFPCISNLAPVDRYHMAECLLSTGLSGPCVSAALQEAIDEPPATRDEQLISLLLRSNADVNFNDGAGMFSAISQRDVQLLETMLQSRPKPQVAAAGILRAMVIDDYPLRAHMVSLLIRAGAAIEGNAVAEALASVLQSNPVDMMLLSILLEQGKADVNYLSGTPIINAAKCPDPSVLELVLQKGKPAVESLNAVLSYLAGQPTCEAKAAKVGSILRRTPQKESVNDLLVKEVHTLLHVPSDKRLLSVLKAALSSGADVNAHKAAALCHSVRAGNEQITDILLAAKPSPSSLAAAMPHALHISDPMDRLTSTQKLLDTGAPESEANVALKYAIDTYPDDLPLIGTLAAKAQSSDGEALLLAVQRERPETVEILLSKTPRKYTVPIVNRAFDVATKGGDKEKRVAICTLLLKAGASGSVISDALLAAAAGGDIALGAVLMEQGADVEHCDGQAIVAACRAGAADVLQMLLSSKVELKKETLVRGFQAATEVGDLNKRGDVFKLLLNKGASGEVVDAQLVSAASFGEDGIDLVRLLLKFGASVDYNHGEAVWTATRCAFMESLEMMLGVVDVGARQQKPCRATLMKALKASWRLSKEPRYQVIEWLFKAGLPAAEEIHVALNKAVNEEPDMRLIQLLLNHGASPLSNGCKTLIDATQKVMLPMLAVFLESDIPPSDLAWVFAQSYTPELAHSWLSVEGLEVAKVLLEKGARGDGLAVALSLAIDGCGTDRDKVARQFIELFLRFKADVNSKDGLALQQAARRADSVLIRQILEQKPNSQSLSMAFPYIFESKLSEDETLALITIFTDYHDGEDRLDVMFVHPESQPVVFRAVEQFPRSKKMLQALLDAGYYHDQMTTVRVMQDVEEDEPVSLLFWCLLQPQKKVSSAIIEMLIDRGAKVNFETRLSKRTPLMLAVQSRRQDIVKALILAGAEVDVTDVTGNTPLTMATQIGGELGTSIMSNVLAAEPSRNDGSLHNAARELNLQALKVLIEYGHDIDFPSPIHGGRSALGELCLHASDAGELSGAKEKAVERTVAYLIDNGSDLTLQSDGKSVLLLALEAVDPVATTRALLKVGMWKHINQLFNHYTDGQFTYSPTQYVMRVLPASDTQSQLLTLLKANRAMDVFYANDGPQPEGAVNLPDELLRAERDRRARHERFAAEAEDHSRSLARTREIATVQDKIAADRAELEAARTRRRLADELDGMRERSIVADEVFAAELRRRKVAQAAALEHERAAAEAVRTRDRMAAEQALEMDGRRHERALEWEQELAEERTATARQISAVKVREREDMDRIDLASDTRIKARIAEQKRLVEAQSALANRIISAGGTPGRRQIGHVLGELEQ